MSLIKAIEKTLDVITKVMLWISMILLAIIIIVVTVNVVGRTLRIFVVGGINEIVRYGVLLVMSLALGRTAFNNGHVIVRVILDKFPKKARGIVAFVELLLAALAFFLAFYVCIQLVPEAVTSHMTTEVYKIPFYYVYSALGFGLAFTSVVFVFKAIESLVYGLKPAEKSEEGGE